MRIRGWQGTIQKSNRKRKKKGKKEFFNSTFKESHNLKLNVVKYAKIYLHGTKIDHKK